MRNQTNDMRGLKTLKFYSDDDEIGPAILERFGTFENLYMKTFELHFRIYQLSRELPDESEYNRWMFYERLFDLLAPEKIEAYEALLTELQKIDNKLEQCEILGWEVTTDIGHDFDDIKMRKQKKEFEIFLNRNPGLFPNLKEWLSKLQ